MLYQRSIILRQATRRTSHSAQAYRYYGQNRIEKIVQKFLLPSDSNPTVHSGDYVTIQPKHFMTHDNSGAVINK
jgi:homoaconitate hydratase